MPTSRKGLLPAQLLLLAGVACTIRPLTPRPVYVDPPAVAETVEVKLVIADDDLFAAALLARDGEHCQDLADVTLARERLQTVGGANRNVRARMIRVQPGRIATVQLVSGTCNHVVSFVPRRDARYAVILSFPVDCRDKDAFEQLVWALRFPVTGELPSARICSSRCSIQLLADYGGGWWDAPMADRTVFCVGRVPPAPTDAELEARGIRAPAGD